MPLKNKQKRKEWSKEYHKQRYKNAPQKLKNEWMKNTQQHRKERKKLLDSIKDVPCADCCNYFPPECMDFDHILEKENEVSRLGCSSLDKLFEEIAKCEIICSNCHRIRTRKRKEWS